MDNNGWIHITQQLPGIEGPAVEVCTYDRSFINIFDRECAHHIMAISLTRPVYHDTDFVWWRELTWPEV